MKTIALLLLLFINICVFAHETIVFSYQPNIKKISYDGGRQWQIKHLLSTNVKIERLNGFSKYSSDYGKTWKINFSNNQKHNITTEIVSNDEYTIKLSDFIEGKSSIELYDIYGIKQIIDYSCLSKNELLINLQNQITGVYFIVLKTSNSAEVIRKLLVL